MCGIYGTTIRYSERLLRDKLDRVKFRGPDHTGLQHYKVSEYEELTLGHNRLAIIDLESRSNQPFDYNEHVSIVFNGEIYNYRELKETYLSGIEFKTSSDTEVICAMYEKFGTECLSYLNGMFAFVIYDRRNQSLVGARDRLGKKPFYYQISDKGIEFASQLSQIQLGNRFAIDEMARQFYLLLSYIPDPYCIYKEVRKLRAGHYFVYSICDHTFQEKEYWNIFSNSCKFDIPKSYGEAKETVKTLLYDSVKRRLEADVPVGVFLSGGIDSSLVAAIAAQINPQISCYTIGFEDKRFDESGYAGAVADALHLSLTRSVCGASEMLSMLDQFTDYFDEPFADVSLIPTSLVAKKARQNVTVALGGDGGDELFWGYARYLRLKQIVWLYKYPVVKSTLFHILKPFLTAEKYYDKLQYSTAFDAHLASHQRYYGAENYNRLEIAKQLPDAHYLGTIRGLLSLSDYDMKEYMNSCINTKTDRSTMRFSLELRSPIMDYRLAEYSRLLPLEYVYGADLGQKRILKDILYGFVDRRLLERSKQGFGAPIGQWFKSDLKESFLETVSLDNVSQLLPELDAAKIIRSRDMFLSGHKFIGNPLWVLYAYIKWMKASEYRM